MSKTIYGIFVGYYSDWKCIGYCSSKEEAEKRVAKQNAPDDYYYDDEYVIEIPCLDGKIDDSDIVVCYTHEVVFYTNDKWKTYTMLDDPNNYEISLKSKFRYPLIIEDLNVVRIKVPLRPGCNDRKIAERIAYDVFYAGLYQRRNINVEEHM